MAASAIHVIGVASALGSVLLRSQCAAPALIVGGGGGCFGHVIVGGRVGCFGLVKHCSIERKPSRSRRVLDLQRFLSVLCEKGDWHGMQALA